MWLKILLPKFLSFNTEDWTWYKLRVINKFDQKGNNY